jgi:ribosomal protein S18 acetylase RimI-like enzyme
MNDNLDNRDAQPADLRILTAEASHLDLVAPLFDAYRQFYRQPADLGGARAYLAARLERGESAIFLALLGASDGTVAVGFTQLYPSYSSISLRAVWILYDLFVAAEARRSGVGRALLRHARAFAAGSGAGEMTLQTAVDNAPAQALYTALGWVRDDEYLTFNLAL